jgi:hypothetical protein
MCGIANSFIWPMHFGAVTLADIAREIADNFR